MSDSRQDAISTEWERLFRQSVESTSAGCFQTQHGTRPGTALQMAGPFFKVLAFTWTSENRSVGKLFCLWTEYAGAIAYLGVGPFCRRQTDPVVFFLHRAEDRSDASCYGHSLFLFFRLCGRRGCRFLRRFLMRSAFPSFRCDAFKNLQSVRVVLSIFPPSAAAISYSVVAWLVSSRASSSTGYATQRLRSWRCVFVSGRLNSKPEAG